METEKKKGTYERPDPGIIASVVKEMRTYRGWKQFALAHEAGVTLRTVERLEAGERVSDDTLSKIEKALKFKEGAFTQARYSPSDDELAAMLQKMKDEYTHTALHDLSGPPDLENVLTAHAYLVDGAAVDDSLADSIALVKDQVQDCGDIYSDVPHTARLGFCRDLLNMIREIEAQGYTARWARYVTDDKFNVGVLTFFKTADLETSQHFRHGVVPRFLLRSLST
jgi:transcriptional regulator with XRE-family HTH domain